MAVKSVYYNRLHKLAVQEGLSDRALSLKLGLNENTINKIGKELSSNVVCQIYRIYPQINLHWLICGIGDNMFVEGGKNSTDMISRFFLDEYRNLQVENRELIAENAVLKDKLSEALHANDYDSTYHSTMASDQDARKNYSTGKNRR